MENTRNAEALFQTTEQKSGGTVTFRVFIDNAWRNVEGLAEWKSRSQKELIRLIEEAYYTPK
jgi:hypothetical protein